MYGSSSLPGSNPPSDQLVVDRPRKRALHPLRRLRGQREIISLGWTETYRELIKSLVPFSQCRDEEPKPRAPSIWAIPRLDWFPQSVSSGSLDMLRLSREGVGCSSQMLWFGDSYWPTFEPEPLLDLNNGRQHWQSRVGLLFLSSRLTAKKTSGHPGSVKE